jgi:hypothetical protein
VFKKQWGEPVSEKKEWLMHAAGTGYITGVGYAGLESSPTAFALFETVILVPRLFPPQTYTWDKGDYLIDVTFSNPTFGDSKQALYWRWRHKKDKNDDWLLPDVEKPFYFLMGYSSGGDDVFASIDGNIKHSIGFGTTMMLGYEYQLPSIGDYSIKAAAGIKYSGIVIPQAGAKLVEYPIDVIFMSKLGNTPAYFGAGLSYKLNPSLYQFTASNSKLELDNTFSGVVQLEYKSVSSSSVVFRYEYLTYSSNTTIDIKANNFGTYFVRYF